MVLFTTFVILICINESLLQRRNKYLTIIQVFQAKKLNSTQKLNCSFRYILLLVVKLNTQLYLMSSIYNSLPKSL